MSANLVPSPVTNASPARPETFSQMPPWGGPPSAPPAEGGIGEIVSRSLAAIKRYRWLILVVITVGVGAGFLLTRFVSPMYVVQAKVWIQDNSGGRDDFFGYLDVGAEITTAITFLPERMGPWQASAGLHWLLLGDNNEERNGGDTSELIFSVGVSTRW